MNSAMSDPGKKSYGEILRSSALIGGSSALNMVFGILRTKAMALLLGPAGVGLLGLYIAIPISSEISPAWELTAAAFGRSPKPSAVAIMKKSRVR